ncbi:MAG TPA: DUF1835 domain-containing protein [Kofleriaceae bacterium]|nr:DUF1835 domain-containing protein [Kofleriaceae bacterium]
MSIVHVVNGESTEMSLGEAELPGEILVWADALDEGPVLPLPDDEYRSARAQFWKTRGLGDAGDKLAKADRAFDDAAQHAEELVLWYEHDLFDQLALVRLLARLGKHPPKAQVTIVSIDRHDEIADFRGLGQLEAHQLAALWPRRTSVAREAIDEAAAAWLAVTAPDPRGVSYLAKRIRVMPFLGPALERHLEDFPDSATGLSRTEAQIVRAIEHGASTPAAVMKAMPAGERYFVTDLALAHHLRVLAEAGAIEAKEDGALATTPLAKDILSGKVDRVASAGIDAWRGGVHLMGKGPLWRFDLASRKMTYA